jgi:hypothetical protein
MLFTDVAVVIFLSRALLFRFFSFVVCCIVFIRVLFIYNVRELLIEELAKAH